MKLQRNTNYLLIALLLLLVEIWIAFVIKTGFIRYTFGDYLVVILLYALIRGCTDLSVRTTALLVLFVAYGIELLQLTSYLTYFNLEHSKIAKLVLGSTFHISDIIAYTVGIITVILIEKKS